MKFRIFNYLSLKIFFYSFFYYRNKKNIQKFIEKKLLQNSNKKFLAFSNYCRTSFILILQYLKLRHTLKNEVIVSPYNLPEMINIILKMNLKPIFCDIEYESGFYDLEKLKKKINHKTISILLTNMFNSYDQNLKLKKIAKDNNIPLIEDNAIYFDNYSKRLGSKFFSGSIGDYSILSFNIMKNLPALYGGAVLTNDKIFYNFVLKEKKKYLSFPKNLFLKQIIIYLVLKTFSNEFLYKNIFFYLIKIVSLKNIKFFLKIFYPSLRFKKHKLPTYYFSNMTSYQRNLLYFQLKDNKNRKENFTERKKKNIYYYKKLKKIKNKNLHLIKMKDFNFQNFIDFPILVKKRDEMHKYLLKNSIDTRLYYYRNCEYIFEKKIKSLNAMKYENEILCLPNGRHITFTYIDKIIKIINNFSY